MPTISTENQDQTEDGLFLVSETTTSSISTAPALVPYPLSSPRSNNLTISKRKKEKQIKCHSTLPTNFSPFRVQERYWKGANIQPTDILVSSKITAPSSVVALDKLPSPLMVQAGEPCECCGGSDFPAQSGTGEKHHIRLLEYALVPGLLHLKGVLSLQEQLHLSRYALQQVKLPNVNNLDTHYHIPSRGVWQSVVLFPESHFPLKGTGIPESSHSTSDEKSIQEGKTSPIDQLESEFKCKINIDPPTTIVRHLSQLDPAKALRRLRWTSIGMQYHWATKSYYPGNSESSPPMPEMISKLCRRIVQGLEGHGFVDSKTIRAYRPEAGIINSYQYRDTLMAHQDRSEENKMAPLVSISLGNVGLFCASPSQDILPVSILLEPGDVVVLCGPARQCFHGVPRVVEGTCPLYERMLSSDPVCNQLESNMNRVEQDEWKMLIDFLAKARLNINVRQVFD